MRGIAQALVSPASYISRDQRVVLTESLLEAVARLTRHQALNAVSRLSRPRNRTPGLSQVGSETGAPV
jgi:hypothetical protein